MELKDTRILTKITYSMKKKLYLAPETVILSMVVESTFICASGTGSNLTIDDEPDDDGYWDY